MVVQHPLAGWRLTERAGVCYYLAKLLSFNGCDGDEYAAGLRRSEPGVVEAGHAAPPKIPPEPPAERITQYAESGLAARYQRRSPASP